MIPRAFTRARTRENPGKARKVAGLAFLIVMARTMAMARAARTNEKAKERRATRRARTKANPTREGLWFKHLQHMWTDWSFGQ